LFVFGLAQLKVSGPSDGSEESEVENLITVCNQVNPFVHCFSLQYNTTHAEISVSVDGGGANLTSTVIPFSAGSAPLVLSFGSTPSE